MNERFLSGELPSKATVCPDCGSSQITTRQESETLKFIDKGQNREIVISIPVRKCDVCALEYTDEETERIRHEAVCRAQGLLTPKEIRALRCKLELSRCEFSDLTRLGEASIARWERGELLQNEANDSYLYLMSFPDNVQRLRGRAGSELPTSFSTEEISKYDFLEVIITPDLQAKARQFHLTRQRVVECIQ